MTVSRPSAADLKSLTHLRQDRVQGLQIESGTRIIGLLVPVTFRSPRKGIAADAARTSESGALAGIIGQRNRT